MSGDLIAADDSLIVRSYDDKCSYILQVNGEKKINKSRVSLKEIIGQPYGAVFELNNRKFVRVSNTEQAAFELYDADDNKGGESTEVAVNLDNGVRGDNSTFVDTNTAQKLTNEDIKNLKESGTSATDIIKSLIQNSDTFAAKTDYAQAKWIKKKENKYRRRYKVLRSNPMTICEASFDKNKEKICNLRFDSLAQIISQSGVHSGTRVLVMDSMTGLLVGSLAYRMRGQGTILALYGGQQPHLEMVNSFNLSAEDINIIQPVPSTELGPAARDVCANGFSYAAADDADAFTNPFPATTYTSQLTAAQTKINSAASDNNADDAVLSVGHKRSYDGATSAASANSTEDSTMDVSPAVNAPQVVSFGNDTKKSRSAPKGGNRTGKTDAERTMIRSYLRQGVDRLIIATKYRPLPILKQALYVLQPSSSFVLFHEFLEPLVDCYLYLQANNLALRLVLSDTWMREFQTLPGRVRPDMFMSTSGGFLLSGIYIGMVPCAYPFGESAQVAENAK